MKDELIELLESLDAQIDGRIPLDNPCRDALVVLQDWARQVTSRLQRLELAQHDAELRAAGIRLTD